MDWESGSWAIYRVNAQPLLLTIDGKYSSFKRGDDDNGLECSALDLIGTSRTACASITGGYYILIDNDTGKMGFSFLSGALNNRDSVFASAYNCTKF